MRRAGAAEATGAPRDGRVSAYGELRSGQILATIGALEQRIEERFPASGLSRVCAELREMGEETARLVERLRRPMWPLRVGVGAALVVIVTALVAVAALSREVALEGPAGIAELLQAVEAAVNEVIFLALSVYFLFTLETRAKRRLALRSLHRLRSVVHIVDMHQLTKDPEYLRSPAAPTASSPERTLSRFELARYLDYCSELLSLTSKLAALHAQYLVDPVVMGAVNEIETLASGFSGKIWQKIMILDTSVLAADAPEAAGGEASGASA